MIRLLSASRRFLFFWTCLALCATCYVLISIRTSGARLESRQESPRQESETAESCQCNLSRDTTTRKPSTTTCTRLSREELNFRYFVNVNSTDLLTVEDLVFAETRPSAEAYIDDVNAAMMSSVNASVPYYNNNTAFQNANERNIQIGNYTYFAGGRWRPTHCTPEWKVAIVIPYRDRAEHLAILLLNLLQVLTLQNLEFGIFVAEQANSDVFNRGLMKNIGYMEATNFGKWDCVIFHDIDQIPMRGANYYGCDEMPKHLCAFAEEMGFKLMYGTLFGGVIGLTSQQMKRSNGYSNVYWGWGGEDDDIRARLNRLRYPIKRATQDGFYKTLRHTKKKADEICKDRGCYLKRYYERMNWDGISHTRYDANVTLNLLYTHIAVDVRKEKWNTYKCKS